MRRSARPQEFVNLVIDGAFAPPLRERVEQQPMEGEAFTQRSRDKKSTHSLHP